MPPKKDFDDLDLTEKLLRPAVADKSTRAVSVSEDEEDSVASPDIVWISEPCATFSNVQKQQGCRRTTRTRTRSSLGSCLCKCVLITFLLTLVLTMVTTAVFYAKLKDVVQHLTIQGHHRSFPVIDMSDAQVDVVKDRVKLFVDELRRGGDDSTDKPLDDLVLTQDEINGLLCHSDYLRGNMQVTLSHNKILEEYSLPMDMFPGGKGRYLDGHDSTKLLPAKNRMELQMETTALHKDWFAGPIYLLNLSYTVNDSNQYHQRLLEVFLENGSTIFGHVIPDDFIQEHNNLLEGAYSDPDSGFDVRTVVDGIQAVQILDGKIVVMPRRRHDPIDNVEEQEEEEEMHIVPANPFPISSESDDAVELAAIEWYQEPVPVEQQQPEEPITVEFIAEALSEKSDSMDTVDHDDDSEGTHDAKKAAEDATFLRSHKVPAAAPTKAASVTAATTTTTTKLRSTKNNP